MIYKNDQEEFWAETYGREYIKKNSDFNLENGVQAWQKMLSKTSALNSFLECGCNLGRNLEFINAINPLASKSIIEISKTAFDIVTSAKQIKEAFNGSIMDSNFEFNKFDLVFTMGVLIHIHPNELVKNMQKIFNYSKKYILVGEYFNPIPISIEYQGENEKLFKNDFGKVFLKNFEVSLVDYGFLWSEDFGISGFDDINWWLFKKK